MSIVLQSSGGGSVTIQEPATASNLTATLPAATGQIMVSGNMPAFSAYQSTLQSISNNTFTKLQFQTKEFDTNSNYDATTNYRFTPTVAGYYQINAHGGFGSSQTGESLITIYKNGSEFKRGTDSNSSTYGFSVSALIYFNGSTDYAEIYILQNTGSSQNTLANQSVTYFQAAMIRTA